MRYLLIPRHLTLFLRELESVLESDRVIRARRVNATRTFDMRTMCRQRHGNLRLVLPGVANQRQNELRWATAPVIASVIWHSEWRVRAELDKISSSLTGLCTGETNPDVKLYRYLSIHYQRLITVNWTTLSAVSHERDHRVARVIVKFERRGAISRDNYNYNHGISSRCFARLYAMRRKRCVSRRSIVLSRYRCDR